MVYANKRIFTTLDMGDAYLPKKLSMRCTQEIVIIFLERCLLQSSFINTRCKRYRRIWSTHKTFIVPNSCDCVDLVSTLSLMSSFVCYIRKTGIWYLTEQKSEISGHNDCFPIRLRLFTLEYDWRMSRMAKQTFEIKKSILKQRISQELKMNSALN